jgi:hypothetical protein
VRLARAKVYRNIELRQEWLGLEPFDALALITAAWVLLALSRRGLLWNVAILVVLYAGLRIVKRGKPEGYTTALVRHYVRRPFFSALAPDAEGVRHPFLGARAGRLPAFSQGDRS